MPKDPQEPFASRLEKRTKLSEEEEQKQEQEVDEGARAWNEAAPQRAPVSGPAGSQWVTIW